MRKAILQSVVILFLSTAAVMSAPAERWIHVRVESPKAMNAGVTLNLPIQMASAVLPAISVDQPHHGKFSLQASISGVDLRAVLDATCNSPDGKFITFERHEKVVSVAKSGQDLVIKIADKPSAEHRLNKTVVIKVPAPVLRAMVTEDSDQVNLGAGLRTLALQGELDVTMRSEKETVRVWTDTTTESN